MAMVHIEHPVRDFERWKAAFDSDPADRRASGVQRYSIQRAADDPAYVAIDLDFASVAVAEAFLATMQRVWGSTQAQQALAGAPRARIMEVVEAVNVA
ncbi:MAG: hypothetical protein ABI534_05080 [Chloroflexota bacterium]